MLYRPKVSVLMPAYNDAHYIAHAIESILNQQYEDFELIIIDDNSTDCTLEIIENYQKQDSRIRVICNNCNHGVARSLNKASNLASCDLIARMDSDDISLPQRLEKQVAFMNAHPQVGVLGTQSIFIDELGQKSKQFPWEQPTDHNSLIWLLLFFCPICHPSVMMRTKLFHSVGGYNPDYANEDMELWTRMAFITKLANLDEVLLLYRMPLERHNKLQDFWEPYIQKVSLEYAERILEKSIDKSLIETLFKLKKYDFKYFKNKITLETISKITSLVDELADALKSKKLFEQDNLEAIESSIKNYKTKIRILSFISRNKYMTNLI